MALEIRSIPVLTGETAERFVREAEENERNPQRRKLVFSFEDIDRIMERSRKYMKEHGDIISNLELVISNEGLEEEEKKENKNDKKTEKKPHFYHNFIKKLHFSHKWFIIFA